MRDIDHSRLPKPTQYLGVPVAELGMIELIRPEGALVSSASGSVLLSDVLISSKESCSSLTVIPPSTFAQICNSPS